MALSRIGLGSVRAVLILIFVVAFGCDSKIDKTHQEYALPNARVPDNIPRVLANAVIAHFPGAGLRGWFEAITNDSTEYFLDLDAWGDRFLAHVRADGRLYWAAQHLAGKQLPVAVLTQAVKNRSHVEITEAGKIRTGMNSADTVLAYFFRVKVSDTEEKLWYLTPDGSVYHDWKNLRFP